MAAGKIKPTETSMAQAISNIGTGYATRKSINQVRQSMQKMSQVFKKATEQEKK